MTEVTKSFIAHARMNSAGEWLEPHSLEDHLRSVANLASEFACKFDSAEWARLAGRWHDLGKYQSAFQDYIRERSGFERENAHIEQGTSRVTHSTAGAIHAVETLGQIFGHILAYPIAGHHAGLPDWDGGQGSLKYRLQNSTPEYSNSRSNQIPADILAGTIPTLHPAATSVNSIALWVRMLFSCLVDADFLDTELYMSPDKSKARNGHVSLSDLGARLNASLSEMEAGSAKTELNRIRKEVRLHCTQAASWAPGIFSLTVPTGGGKTLSSLAFALEHARMHGKARVIYAIPFTSIIDQTASVFADILGADNVLEHHSNLDLDESRETGRSRLATENWSAPLIITTNVQLFESIFASRTSKCRKLHNLANSIIILDEAQQLPRDFHKPITEAMNQLSEFFGVTWVLCTATQPSLGEQRDALERLLLRGVRNVREIIPDVRSLALKLQRVQIQLPDPNAPSQSWEQVGSLVSQEECVLVIVNTRKDARHLCTMLTDQENTLHLSANMCAAHRAAVLKEVRKRLAARRNGERRPLRLVSTQLIEAGVDVDFPVVYRAIAGLDSIAQSAGRCNREGRLPMPGKVVVFNTESRAPAGPLRQAAETTLALLGGKLINDPLSPEAMNLYFTQMNAKGDRDRHGICALLQAASPTRDAPLAIQFRKAAEKFKLIDDNGITLIVPYCAPDEAESAIEKWLGMLDADDSAKWIYKKLQRFSITVPDPLVRRLESLGVVTMQAGMRVVESSHYDQRWGLKSPDELATVEECVI